MPFKAKRLRVQLPCGDETHVVEAADDRGICILVASPPPICFNLSTTCDIAATTPIPCGLAFTDNMCPGAGSRCGDFPSLCAGVASGGPGPGGGLGKCHHFHTCEGHFTLIIEKALGQAALVDTEHLPLLKGRLEQRLKEIDAFAQGLRDNVEAELEEIAKAEQALKDREAEE